MPCCGEYELIAESLLISAQTTTTTSEYGNIWKPLVATRTSEQKLVVLLVSPHFQRVKTDEL